MPEPEPESESKPEPSRCRWAGRDALLRAYHDDEWGVPERDSRALWEKLVLDGFQAGLSWRTILAKRAAFRAAFCGFDPAIVAGFGDADVARLLADPGIVRSAAKIRGAIRNAQAFLAMRRAGEDLSALAWAAVGGAPLRGDGSGSSTRSDVADGLARALRERGFSFVGPVIVHAWMQATGLIDDHEDGCFRRTRRPAHAPAAGAGGSAGG